MVWAAAYGFDQSSVAMMISCDNRGHASPAVPHVARGSADEEREGGEA